MTEWKVIYDDEKDICTMVFESVLFEDTHTGRTPLSYFVNKAPLSADEKRLYEFIEGALRVRPKPVGANRELDDCVGHRVIRNPYIRIIQRRLDRIRAWCIGLADHRQSDGNSDAEQLVQDLY